MSTSSQDPFLIRIREIAETLRRISEVERLVGDAVPASGLVNSFYQGALQASARAAGLLDEAIAAHLAKPVQDPVEAREVLLQQISRFRTGGLRLLSGGRGK